MTKNKLLTEQDTSAEDKLKLIEFENFRKLNYILDSIEHVNKQKLNFSDPARREGWVLLCIQEQTLLLEALSLANKT